MYTATHQYLSVIGEAFNLTEKWQFGLRLQDATYTNDAVAFAAQSVLKDWWTASGTFGVNTGFGSLNTHTISEIKVAKVQPDGTYPAGTISSSYFYPVPVAGVNVPDKHTMPQDSVAITLTTPVPRGLGSKGRIYLPPSTRYQIEVDGRLAITSAQSIMDSVRLLLQGLNAKLEIGTISVMSRGRGVPNPPVLGKKPTYTYPNAGVTNAVTGIKVGRVIDTQRRRRRSITELPLSVAI
jgi:hypothetical protein